MKLDGILKLPSTVTTGGPPSWRVVAEMGGRGRELVFGPFGSREIAEECLANLAHRDGIYAGRVEETRPTPLPKLCGRQEPSPDGDALLSCDLPAGHLGACGAAWIGEWDGYEYHRFEWLSAEAALAADPTEATP